VTLPKYAFFTIGVYGEHLCFVVSCWFFLFLTAQKTLKHIIKISANKIK